MPQIIGNPPARGTAQWDIPLNTYMLELKTRSNEAIATIETGRLSVSQLNTDIAAAVTASGASASAIKWGPFTVATQPNATNGVLVGDIGIMLL